ncbi:MAG: GTPase Era [Alphaproteobacteria bacterium]
MVSDSSLSSVETRCGFVAVLGVPNAGKSTLVNQCVGQKISIVSSKVQTTRHRVLGIALHDHAQIIFMDTPGIFSKPKKRLERAMVHQAWQTPEEADMALLLVDAQKPAFRETFGIFDALLEKKTPLVVVLNKIDLISKERLLAFAEKFNHPGVQKIFMISAKQGDGVDDLLDWVGQVLPKSPWLFPEDQISDMPQRLLAAEITREHLFHQLFDELPYALHVETEAWERFRNKSVKISQQITVEKESQRAIILGHQGQKIGYIGKQARQEMELLFGHPVHLFLHVKVRSDWAERPDPYKTLGLEFKV